MEKGFIAKFKPDGTFSLEAENFHGQGCTALLDKLSAGNKVTKEVLKDEIYESNSNNNKLDTWV